MAAEFVTHKRIVLVVWGKPELSDLARCVSAVREANKKCGTKVVFVARVPSMAEAPDDTVRKGLSKIIPQIMQYSISYHAVMEGTGFVNAAKRTVLATIFLMTGRSGFHVHARPEEIVGTVPADLRADAISALQDFRARGFLDRNLKSLFPSAA